jgi:Domain of unknown function (DUF1848)
MIVSASYKTDIPAFYAEWFLNRLDAGFARTVNPYSRRIQTVPLTRDSVDGFVFWTRNVGPFFGTLDEVRRRGFPFVVQYTITAYPRALDRATIPAEQAIDHLHRLNKTFGNAVSVWRYDPVVMTSLTPPDWHVAAFSRLCSAIAGAVDEVVLSFAHVYRKTARNLNAAARLNGFQWLDPSPPEKVALLSRLAAVAAESGLKASLCGQPDLLASRLADGSATGLSEARCIDAGRLGRAAGDGTGAIQATRKPHRARCGCFSSRDIGEYDTCPHGCVYCYAVNSRNRAKEIFARHCTGDEGLIIGSDRAIRRSF